MRDDQKLVLFFSLYIKAMVYEGSETWIIFLSIYINTMRKRSSLSIQD